MDLPIDRTVSWRPAVAGVAEVFHAQWHDHAYPGHTHDTWTLLVVDDGVIGYDLDRHDHTAVRSGVTLLPPHVVHDGRALTSTGFRKRVVYLEHDVIAPDLVGAAVDAPLLPDAALRSAVSRLDRALVARDDLEAESRLALVVERLTAHLVRGHRAPVGSAQPVAGQVARLAREMLDADPVGTPASPPSRSRSASRRRTSCAPSPRRTASRPTHTSSVGVSTSRDGDCATGSRPRSWRRRPASTTRRT